MIQPMADPPRRHEPAEPPRRRAGDTPPPSERNDPDPSVQEFQRARAELVRAAADRDATGALDRLVERWAETERRLLEESAHRIHDFELGLRHEWEALRQRHEEPVRDLETRGAALSQSYAAAARAANNAILRAHARLEALEQGIATQMAEAARHFREATAAVHAPRSPEAPHTVTDLPRRSQRLITALLFGFALLLMVSGYLYDRLAAANEQAAAAEHQARELRQQMQMEANSTKQALQSVVSDALSATDRTERMVNVLAAADLQRFELAGEGGAPAANGQALWSLSHGLILAATGLPRVPAGQIGQAWLVTTRGPLSLGFLSPDGQGRVTAAFDAPPELAGVVTGFMLTIERVGGNSTPTGPVLLASSRR